ncbi:hypothetical protein AB0O00_35820, partial [Kitasatospora sp. NPDC093558]
MADGHFEVRAIGRVESPLLDRSGAPRQGDEGTPVLDVKPVLARLDERHEGLGQSGTTRPTPSAATA